MINVFEQYLGKRKADILAAVVELADSGGIRSITTKKIAEKVGFVEGALYKHIKSKNEALSLILDLAEKILTNRFEEIEKKQLHGEEALRDFFLYSLEILKYYPGLYRILLSDELYIENRDFFSKFKDIAIYCREKIKKIIEDGKQRGIFRQNIDPGAAALLFLGVSQTAFNAWNVVEEREKNLVESALPIFDECLRGLLKEC